MPRSQYCAPLCRASFRKKKAAAPGERTRRSQLEPQIQRTHTQPLPGVSSASVDAWDESAFSDPATLANSDYAAFRLLVHTVNCGELERENGMQLFREGTKALNQWDTISASVIDENNRFTYATVGVVLRAPKQNILLTSFKDMDFDGNKGNLDRQKNWLIPSQAARIQAMPAHGRNGLLMRHILDQADRYPIISPEEVLASTKRLHQEHNEVIVMTRPDVFIQRGAFDGERLIKTGPVEIAAIFRAQGESRAAFPNANKEALIAEAIRLAQENLGDLPLLEIPGMVTNVD
ncbi:hypothetical protein [Caballeronia sp. LZ043]|uniref:hypothetical protein n=1 Tax=Caballeronia sp. LZ043 TaxID=3038569 RepID=UPI002860DCA8|nr:hypothetical protein [Caballeronia sp. LZ043]MDR5825154.1 hypothetical protein [Caballeronia sp. LZ043]